MPNKILKAFFIKLSQKNTNMSSSSLNNQFATNVKSNNKDNNIVVTIEGLFLNIRYKLSYKRLTKKVVYKTYKFFMHSVKYIVLKTG